MSSFDCSPRGEESAAAQNVRVPILTNTACISTSRVRWHPGQGGRDVRGTEKEGVMLWTAAVVLLVLWALGMSTSYTGGGLVHVLLVIAAIVVVFQLLGGRRRTV